MGSVHVPNCKSFLVTEAEMKHVRRRAISTTWRRELSSFFSLQGKAPKEIHVILMETFREYAPSYDSVKNWVAKFKLGDFFHL